MKQELKKRIFNFNFIGREFIIKDYVICSSFISQVRGLMFRPKNFKKPLLFVLNKEKKMPIHSFFCRKFIAVWFDKKFEIIDIQLVLPWKSYVIPRFNDGKFSYLLEVPI